MSDLSVTGQLCPNEILSDFLNCINRPEGQLIEFAFAPAGTSKYNRALYYEKLYLNDLEIFQSKKCNIAFLPGLKKSSLPDLCINTEVNRIGGDSLMAVRPIVSFDIDFKDNYKDYNLDTKEAIKTDAISKIMQLLDEHNISPWIIAFSGNGIHLHFKFNTPLIITSVQRYKQSYDALRSYLECILGFKFDPSCSNPSRLIRLPFSTNWKDATNPTPCEIIHFNKNNDCTNFWPHFLESCETPNLPDKKSILLQLNLLKIFEYFGYTKTSSIKEKNGQIICSGPFSLDSNPSFYYDANRKIYYDFSKGFGGDLLHLIANMAEVNIKSHFSKVLEIANQIIKVAAKKDPQAKGPSGFFVNDKGVWFQASSESDPQWLSTPVYVDALTRDTTSKHWGRLLTFTDQDNIKKSWSMPMELLAGDGTEIRRHLLSLGVQMAINFKDRQLFLSYLQTTKPNKRAICVSRIGWHQDQYILPDKVFSPINNEQQIILQLREKDRDFSSNNLLKDWQTQIGHYCQGNSRLVFAVSLAFASTILKLTNEESGGFHFVGQSSIGKTITLKIAASVWSNPGLNGFIKRWRSTLNGLELLAASRCDSMLILDELGEIKAQDAGHAAYMLSAGISKTRSTKNTILANQLEWRLLFLSSGEINLATHMENSGEQVSVGQEVRMIDLPAQAHPNFGIFENIHQFKSSSEFSCFISNNAEKYYGTPIIHFLEKLIQDPKHLSLITSLQQEFISKSSLTLITHGQMFRVLKRFSLIAAAGELAIEYGVLPWKKGEAIKACQKLFEEWKDRWADKGCKELQALMSQIKSLFQEYGPSRFPLLQEFRSTLPNHQQKLWGFRVDSQEGQEWLILSEVFRNHFCKGHDYRWATQQLKENGILIKPSASMRVPHLGITRVITFSGKIME